MKEKEKILRIRPFNMANNSSGGMYLYWGAIFSYFVTLPAIFIIGAGMGMTGVAGNGKLDYQILKRKLDSYLKPICLVVFCIVLFASLYLVLFEGMDLSKIHIFLLFGAFPIGIHISMSYSAETLNSKGKLFAGRWLMLSIVYILLFGVVGLFLLLMFSLFSL